MSMVSSDFLNKNKENKFYDNISFYDNALKI